MPIDLDSLIYAVPCGEPGDVNALSGRAHICEDRMSIAVTTCLDEPVECFYCWDHSTPQVIRAIVEDVELCWCVSGPDQNHNGWQLISGQLNNSEGWRVPFWGHGPLACFWRSGIIALVKMYQFNQYCTEILRTAHFEVRVLIARGEMAAPWVLYLEGLEQDGPGQVVFFVGHVQVPSGDCQLPIEANNRAECGYREAGYNGRMRLEDY